MKSMFNVPRSNIFTRKHRKQPLEMSGLSQSSSLWEDKWRGLRKPKINERNKSLTNSVFPNTGAQSDSSSRVQIKLANLQHQSVSQQFILLEPGYRTEEHALPPHFYAETSLPSPKLKFNSLIFSERFCKESDCGNHKAFSQGLEWWTRISWIVFIKSLEVEATKKACMATWMCWPPHFRASHVSTPPLKTIIWLNALDSRQSLSPRTSEGGIVEDVNFKKFSPRFAQSNYCRLIGAHTLNTIDTKVGLKEAWTFRGFVSTVMWSMALWLLVCLQEGCVN